MPFLKSSSWQSEKSNQEKSRHVETSLRASDAGFPRFEQMRSHHVYDHVQDHVRKHVVPDELRAPDSLHNSLSDVNLGGCNPGWFYPSVYNVSIQTDFVDELSLRLMNLSSIKPLLRGSPI